MKIYLKKGFTLIELLVVVAIIALLASIVLAALNSARGKGSNAAIKSNLHTIQTQAEIVYDTASPNSYATICANVNITKALAVAAAASGGTVNPNGVNGANTAGNTTCYQAAGTWVVQSGLEIPESGNNYWCVDSNQRPRSDNILAGANATVCP